MEPPGRKPSRSPVVVLVLLLVAAVAGGVGYFVTQGGDDEKDATGTPGAGTEDTTGSTVAGSAEDLDIVDSGGGPYVDPIFGDQYGWAVVLENHSEQVATTVHVVVEFEDEGGAVVETAEDYIHVIGAGDKFGVGGSIARNDIAGFEVTTIEPAGWASPTTTGSS
jgi:hypothetical protein